MWTEDRFFVTEVQHVTLEPFPIEGWVLDIGGGGEGIIGQLLGDRVVAIDRLAGELKGAAQGPLKIVMDATDLKFLDNTFSNVTVFFSMMYMPKKDHAKVFSEIARVLVPGGALQIWDVTIPPKSDPTKEVFLLKLVIEMPGKEVETGYGTLWSDKGQDSAYYISMAEEAGLTLEVEKHHGETYHLIFRK